MSNAPLPSAIYLEDLNDLCEFYELTGRAVPRERWAEECVAIAKQAAMQKAIEGFIG